MKALMKVALAFATIEGHFRIFSWRAGSVYGAGHLQQWRRA